MFRPDASALLAAAHEALLHQLMPQLPAASRYTALMVANAIGIASRELAAAGQLAQTAAELSRAATATGADGGNAADWRGAERHLARRIRQLDSSALADPVLLGAVVKATHARLAVDNPRALHEYTTTGSADR